MKTFKDYTLDQQNDFYLFHSINSDYDAIKFYIDSFLKTSHPFDETKFHNNLVMARSLLDIIINSINNFENEHKDE